MDKYSVTDLSEMLAAIGEDDTQSILSDFLCPKNHDIENFLRKSAIDFHKKSIAKTHLVFASHEGIPVLVGYFTLTSKFCKFRRIVFTVKQRNAFQDFHSLMKPMDHIKFLHL